MWCHRHTHTHKHSSVLLDLSPTRGEHTADVDTHVVRSSLGGECQRDCIFNQIFIDCFLSPSCRLHCCYTCQALWSTLVCCPLKLLKIPINLLWHLKQKQFSFTTPGFPSMLPWWYHRCCQNTGPFKYCLLNKIMRIWHFKWEFGLRIMKSEEQKRHMGFENGRLSPLYKAWCTPLSHSLLH